MDRTSASRRETLFRLDGRPPIGAAVSMALQHLVAMIVGCVTPAIIVANTVGLGQEDRVLLIQASLVASAVSTLLQLYPIAGRFGSGLPVIMGISFAYVPSMQAAASAGGVSAIAGAMVVGGAVALLVGIFVRQIRTLFPPVITGTVIFTIGLSLYPTAVRYMAGGSGSEWFGTPKSWLVALVTLAVVVFLNNFTKGILKLASILIGMIVGYIISIPLNLVDFSSIGSAQWFALPQFMPFEIKFVPSAAVSLSIVYVVNAVQTIGDLSSTTMGGLDRMPTDRELSGGIIGQGVMSVLGAFFGGLPTATYSQNVGIVTVNRVINRAVFALAAVILLVAGLMPKFASLLTTIPQCVIGGATISVFAAITMTGIRMITQGGFTPRKSAVMGLSVAMGVGITQVSGCLSGAGFPGWVNTVFGSSSVVVATIMAIVLNLIIPKEEEAQK